MDYGFYNSVNGDRTYNAEDMNNMFQGVISYGILRGVGEEFKVTASEALGSVRIGSGKAWLNNTWSHNKYAYDFRLPDGDAITSRIDLLCLVVDKDNRENRIEIKQGEPSAEGSEVQPGYTEGFEYPLAYIKRRPMNLTPEAGDIQDARNITGWSSGLTSQLYESPNSHNSIYRGKFLGAILSQAQMQTIASGEFNDLYLGDYWLTQGIKYTIAGFNLVGNIANNRNHVVVVFETTNSFTFWGNATPNPGDLRGSWVYTSGLNTLSDRIYSDTYGFVLETTGKIPFNLNTSLGTYQGGANTYKYCEPLRAVHVTGDHRMNGWGRFRGESLPRILPLFNYVKPGEVLGDFWVGQYIDNNTIGRFNSTTNDITGGATTDKFKLAAYGCLGTV